jgi:hypothetical protein
MRRFLSLSVLLGACLFGFNSVIGAENKQYDTTFDTVSKKLDKGGTLYFYISPNTFFKGVKEEYKVLEDILLNDVNMTPEDKAKVREILKFIRYIAANSGVPAIDGFGFSSIQIDKELYRARIYAHRKKIAKPGLLRFVAGYKPQKLWLLDAMPVDTVYAFSIVFYPRVLWKWLKEQAEQAKAESVISEMKDIEKSFLEKGVHWDKFLDSFNGEFGCVVTASKSKKSDLNIGGKVIKVDQPDFALVFAVKDDGILNGLKKVIPGYKPVPGDPGRIDLDFPAILPHLKPVIMQRDNFLFVASSPEMVHKIVKAAELTEQDFKDFPEFKRLSRNVPLEGNAFEFVSHRLVEILADALRQSSGSSALEQVAMDLKKRLAIDYFGVMQVADDGYTGTFNANVDPAAILLFKSVVMPVALNVGTVLPAILKARQKAAEVKTTGRLKKVGMALKMYAMDHKDSFPAQIGKAGLAELTKGTKKYIDASMLKAADGRGYCYMGGFKETSNENIPLAFERPHMSKRKVNVLFLNGRVETIKGRIGNCSQLIGILQKKYKYPQELLEKLFRIAAKLDMELTE